MSLSTQSEKTIKRDLAHLIMGCVAMLDGVSLDQLWAFIAVVYEGSFSAVERKLYHMQSAVSGLRAERQAGMVHKKVNTCEYAGNR